MKFKTFCKNKKLGFTLVELIVVTTFLASISLAGFIILNSSSKMHGEGVAISEAKEICEYLNGQIDLSLKNAKGVTLKNSGFSGNNLLSANGDILLNGSSILSSGEREKFNVELKFEKATASAMKINIVISTKSKRKIYTATHTLKFKIIDFNSDKIQLQSDGITVYNGVEYIV